MFGVSVLMMLLLAAWLLFPFPLFFFLLFLPCAWSADEAGGEALLHALRTTTVDDQHHNLEESKMVMKVSD